VKQWNSKVLEARDVGKSVKRRVKWTRRIALLAVVWIAIGGAGHRDRLSRGKSAGFCSILRRICPEHVVERAIFLNDENHVIDFLDAGSFGVLAKRRRD